MLSRWWPPLLAFPAVSSPRVHPCARVPTCPRVLTDPLYGLLADPVLTWVASGWSRSEAARLARTLGGPPPPMRVLDVQVCPSSSCLHSARACPEPPRSLKRASTPAVGLPCACAGALHASKLAVCAVGTCGGMPCSRHPYVFTPGL